MDTQLTTWPLLTINGLELDDRIVKMFHMNFMCYSLERSFETLMLGGFWNKHGAFQCRIGFAIKRLTYFSKDLF